MYRSSPFRSTLNTGINMFLFQVCTEASDAFKNAKKRGKKGTKARKGCVSGSANVPVCGKMYLWKISSLEFGESPAGPRKMQILNENG